MILIENLKMMMNQRTKNMITLEEKQDYIETIRCEIVAIQEDIKQLLKNVKIKEYAIQDEYIRYAIAEWLKWNNFNVRCEDNKVVFL